MRFAAPKTAIIGASGFIGRHLHAAYRRDFPDVVGTAFSAETGGGLVRFDIRRPDLSALRLKETGHGAVLIASAKPNIDFCERERDAAYDVNVRGTLTLARQAAQAGLQVIFFSTDYVFAGDTGLFDDDSPTNPTTEYGRQKVIVEKELPAITDNHLILRLSKIFGLEKGDRTLLDDIASTLAAGRVARVARDQFFPPRMSATSSARCKPSRRAVCAAPSTSAIPARHRATKSPKPSPPPSAPIPRSSSQLNCTISLPWLAAP